MTSPLSLDRLEGADAGSYGVELVRNAAFDAIIRLWRKRQSQGLTQKILAAKTGSQPATVSRNLRGPGNWTLRTFGEMLCALDGSVRIDVYPNDEPVRDLTNSSAYDGYGKNPNGNGSSINAFLVAKLELGFAQTATSTVQYKVEIIGG